MNPGDMSPAREQLRAAQQTLHMGEFDDFEAVLVHSLLAIAHAVVDLSERGQG